MKSVICVAILASLASCDLVCHSLNPKVPDAWCNTNCNHVPVNCPADTCDCTTPPPTPPTPPPPPSPPGPFGQPLLAYYSGQGLETIADSGLNALAIAFFDPAPLGEQECDFSSPTNSCLNYARYIGDIKTKLDALSQNTSPKRGEKPVILFSFGGQSMGGGSWEVVFGSDSSAAQFGENAAALALTVSQQIGARVGIDLDVEGATALPSMGAFISAFRGKAPFEEVPLMLCSFSGLADPANSEHYKVEIMKSYGPEQKGINWLNMMVDNHEASCDRMSGYWRDERLSFLPTNARLFGMWGLNLQAWMLKNPGCTDGSAPLFPWMQSQSTGLAIWELWSGDGTAIGQITDQIRAKEAVLV